jgi:hypothetical protein
MFKEDYMDRDNFILKISDKNFDIDGLAKLVIDDGDIREEVVKQMLTNSGIMVYYHCYYILSKASSEEPQLFYKYWDDFAMLLHHENSYHRDIGLTLIANITRADNRSLFLNIFDDYFKHMNDKKFMTAMCCVRNVIKIYRYKSEAREKIVDTLLNADAICTYPDKQKELLKYDILVFLDEIYDDMDIKEKAAEFIKNGVNSISPKTRKVAKHLVEKYSLRNLVNS